VSKKQEIIFFIDWSIGQRTVPEALRQAGAVVETHLDHFPQEAPDIEWLREVGLRGWVVLTKDVKISSRPWEVEAIARAGVRVFILVAGNLTSRQMASLLVGAVDRMERLTIGNKAPFIAKIYKDGRVQIWKSPGQLMKMFKAIDD
jgi:predicted nuclease of predicted toxin-antitoxin system